MDIPALVEALGTLAWPILAAYIVWKLYPTLVKVFESRAFSIKVGQMELSVQEASDQLRLQVEDLQEKVAELRKHPEGQSDKPPGGSRGVQFGKPASKETKRILMVGPHVESRAYEIATLREKGDEVTCASSTQEALDIMMAGEPKVDGVVTDLLRGEGERSEPDGLSLIRDARKAGVQTPVLVYDSARGVARYRDEIRAAGGSDPTDSPIEFFEFVDGLGTE